MPKYVNKPAWKEQNTAQYATTVENLDTQIGRLIKKLKKSGKLENTFILFISDNGGVYQVTKKRPIRGGKGFYYEGGIRIPLVIRYSGNITAGTVSDNLISLINVTATTLKIAGAEVLENMDGSVISLLGGKEKNTYIHRETGVTVQKSELGR